MFKLEKFIFQSLPFLHAIRYTISKRIRKITQFAGKIYYSQTGEDIILKVLFERQNHGIYVDVGCNHPIKDSNTFHLYMSGWSGICIDANPELCRLFGKIRKRDVILHRAISNSTENETLYLSSYSDKVSTISKTNASEEKFWPYEKSIQVPCTTLDEIVAKYINENSSIDLLSIDVEGYDFQALKTLNLRKIRPHVILIETHTLNERNEISEHLLEFDYKLVYFATMNAYYASLEWLNSQKERPFLGL